MNFCLAPWRGRWARWVPLLLQNVESQQKLEKKNTPFLPAKLGNFFLGSYQSIQKNLGTAEDAIQGSEKKHIDSWPKMVGKSACFPMTNLCQIPNPWGKQRCFLNMWQPPPGINLWQTNHTTGWHQETPEFFAARASPFPSEKIKGSVGQSIALLQPAKHHWNHRVSKNRTGGQNNPQNNPWTGQVGISPWC